MGLGLLVVSSNICFKECMYNLKQVTRYIYGIVCVYQGNCSYFNFAFVKL